MSQAAVVTNNEGAVDVGGAVRRGEELDIEAVDVWLKQQMPDLSGQPEVTQYSGGASNWTYRLLYPNHDLILRRPPAGTKAKSAHDMGREYIVQKKLRPVFPYVPEMLAHCKDESVIGDEFYVMQRLEGLIPRGRMPKGVALDEKQAKALCLATFDRLIDLHTIDIKSAQLDSLGKGAGYVQRQVDGWCARYNKSKTWNVPSFKKTMDYLHKHAPPEVALSIIHNDYRMDNLVLDKDDPTKIIGILDWEMATIGDPLMDLGSTLAYWVQANDDFVIRSMARQPSYIPGMLSRREVIQYYMEKTGFQTEDFRFYLVYGLFRLAGVVQQIYYRYHHGQTDNPDFKKLWLLVHYLNWRCKRVIAGKADI